ncbi:MAG: type II toxin-antitoxin system RelB/DinJ family antitoxin [Defluviitaleaceae bacterium]|nr:type II toxin-antitoxin system RelB/DinJ family antitoxin [Defluviitaleaceae bacterium]
MQKTSNVFARVEPEIKEQAEQVLIQLGIPMSNAIGMFLRQIIVQRGIPFEMRLPVREPVSICALTTEQLNDELEKGYASAIAGRHRSLKDVVTDMERDYGI